jgi:hypothetical protein
VRLRLSKVGMIQENYGSTSEVGDDLGSACAPDAPFSCG